MAYAIAILALALAACSSSDLEVVDLLQEGDPGLQAWAEEELVVDTALEDLLVEVREDVVLVSTDAAVGASVWWMESEGWGCSIFLAEVQEAVQVQELEAVAPEGPGVCSGWGEATGQWLVVRWEL